MSQQAVKIRPLQADIATLSVGSQFPSFDIIAQSSFAHPQVLSTFFQGHPFFHALRLAQRINYW
jgi:hypothetical protein